MPPAPGRLLLVALPLSSTARSTVTRLRERARTDRAELYSVLDSGLVCHLGLVVGGAPVVLPTGYGRIGETMYVHGSTGAGWLRAADGAPVCVTVTHLDGIVYARSVFHHSMNYRSAVVHAAARLVIDPAERLAALRAVAEQLSPGSWDHARPPTRRELAATALLAIDLAEASVKVRTGPPSDDAEDVTAGGRWAGVLPMHTAFGPPRPAPDLDDVAVPRHVDARRNGVT
jgi:nitroimidazol reductase NimA-like FMN-containing flavoprotein (pyridoxamine 5'-phosphate oxidase superfamily)